MPTREVLPYFIEEIFCHETLQSEGTIHGSKTHPYTARVLFHRYCMLPTHYVFIQDATCKN